MKLPMFTASPDVQDETAYKEHRVVSREELTLLRKKGSEYHHSQNKFRSRQDLLHWGEQYSNAKFILGKYLAVYLRELSVKSVLSLGSGECDHEYAIKLAAPEITITATDFDPFVVEKVSEFLPEIDKVEMFDINKDDFAQFQGKYDAILMIGVIYALSNDEVLDFFKRVPSVGANHIIIVTSYLSASGVLKYFLHQVYIHNPLAYLIRRFVLKRNMAAHGGRFHGWIRSKGEFVRLMKKASTVKLHKVLKLKPLSETQVLIHINPTANL